MRQTQSPVGTAPAIRAFLSVLFLTATPALAAEIFVSPAGDDANPGTAARPLKSLEAARNAVRGAAGREPVNVLLTGGTHYLDQTFVLTAEDSGTSAAPVTYRAAPGEEPVLSGGLRLDLTWAPYRDGILQAAVPRELAIDQLFIDGKRQPMARFPNRVAGKNVFGVWNLGENPGPGQDALAPERIARWSQPAGGYLHAMHEHLWGDEHWLIEGKTPDGKLRLKGGWQNNRPSPPHGQYRFVENLIEELDAPGEWFHDRTAGVLYYYPEPAVDPGRARVEVVRLAHLVEFRGSKDKPVRFVNLAGLSFTHTARTFMDNREPLLRSDWTVYRGGAVMYDGAEDCALSDSTFDQVGGNTVFVNRYNRRISLRGLLIRESGANGVAFVGEPKSVRSPLFNYNDRQAFASLDRTPGPATDDYPADCTVEDCLITRTGRDEKQTAPVQISMSMNITVRHCSIYDVPRAGINISEGTFGGHVIEFCDIFDTVMETGDHGSFNSWGRDRYWGLTDFDLNRVTLGEHKDLPLLDVVRPNILRGNRWRCDHGWDIDLDDGSSNYEIRDNLCLNGGIKLREGFYRTCENNIMVNNSFHPHVWYANSQDTFRRNIVFDSYRPIQVNKPWGRECDFNLRHRPGQAEVRPATYMQGQSGLDAHSVEADAMFVDPASGDYRVQENSPALKLGFRNFPMDRFGVRAPRFRALARTPELPAIQGAGRPAGRKGTKVEWKGASLRSLEGEEYSALGVARDAGGVLVLEVADDSEAARAGLRRNDFIQAVDGRPLRGPDDFLQRLREVPAGRAIALELTRGQKRTTVEVRSTP